MTAPRSSSPSRRRRTQAKRAAGNPAPPASGQAVAAEGKTRRLGESDYDRLLSAFASPIAALDCGRFCAPLNDGEPVCCTTENAVPVMDRGEWRLLSGRTDLWSRFRPKDAAGRDIVAESGTLCVAAACKGAAFCERDNRSLSCRAFPFAPYIDAKGDFAAISYFWGFADRCWVISNLHLATKKYLAEFFAAYDALFARDRDEWRANFENAATQRRVHSRRGVRFAAVGRDFRWRWVLPHGAGWQLMEDPAREMARFGPYKSAAAYRRAVAEAGGTAPPALAAEAARRRRGVVSNGAGARAPELAPRREKEAE